MDTKRGLTRRQLLRGATAAMIGVGLGTGCRNRDGFKGQTLTVFVYSGLDAIFQEHFATPFQAATGATVVIDAGWWDAIGKLKASPKGQPAYDLVLTDATQGYPAIRDGMFRQINMDNVPNRAALAPRVLDNWVARDHYGITFHESAQSLVYDRRQVRQEPTGWGDLLRPELRGKLGIYNSFYFSLYTFACLMVAEQGKPGTAAAAIESNIAGVLDYARRERERVGIWWPTGTKMLQDLLQGNFAAGNAHSVTLLPAAKEKPDVVGYLTPEPDRAFVQLMWVIPADTPVPRLAEAAIDYLLRQDVQEAMARRGAGTSHMAAAQVVAAEDPAWARTYPHTDEQFRSLRYYPYEAYFREWDHIAMVWEQEVLRKS